MKMLKAVAGATAVVAAGCASVAGSGKPPPALTLNSAHYATQAVLGPCVGDAESAILTSIASAVIAQGVNRIHEAVKAAAATKTETALTQRNVEVAKGKGLGPCVTIARGWFYRTQPSYGGGASPKSAFAINAKSAWPYNSDEDTPAKFWRTGLFLAATPDFYFQGRIVASTDKSAYAIQPVNASLDTPLVSQFFRPGGERHVLISVALTDVGKGVDLRKAGGTTITLGAMKPGELLRFSDELCIYKRPATGSSQIDCPKPETADLVMRGSFQSDWFSVPLTDSLKPMNLQALVSETQSPSDFLQFVADVLGDSKTAITKGLQEELIPSVGDTADETELAAEEKAQSDYDTAYAKAFAELSGCAASQKDLGKRVAARVATRAVIQAGRKAKRDPGVTAADVEAITYVATEDGVCETVRGKLR